MARMLGVRARDWRGIWRWHPAPPPEEPRFRWLRPARRIDGQMVPHHMKPYLAALELVAMMSLATRALEGDL